MLAATGAAAATYSGTYRKAVAPLLLRVTDGLFLLANRLGFEPNATCSRNARTAFQNFCIFHIMCGIDYGRRDAYRLSAKSPSKVLYMCNRNAASYRPVQCTLWRLGLTTGVGRRGDARCVGRCGDSGTTPASGGERRRVGLRGVRVGGPWGVQQRCEAAGVPSMRYFEPHFLDCQRCALSSRS